MLRCTQIRKTARQHADGVRVLSWRARAAGGAERSHLHASGPSGRYDNLAQFLGVPPFPADFVPTKENPGGFTESPCEESARTAGPRHSNRWECSSKVPEMNRVFKDIQGYQGRKESKCVLGRDELECDAAGHSQAG